VRVRLQAAVRGHLTKRKRVQVVETFNRTEQKALRS